MFRMWMMMFWLLGMDRVFLRSWFESRDIDPEYESDDATQATQVNEEVNVDCVVLCY